MRRLVSVAIVGVLAVYAHGKYQDRAAQRQRQAEEYARAGTAVAAAPAAASARRYEVESVEPPAAPERSEPPPATEPARRCDGRMHCSQMRSCEEATWFLRNCPGMKMDGDNDANRANGGRADGLAFRARC
jgi:hypothetical protein